MPLQNDNSQRAATLSWRSGRPDRRRRLADAACRLLHGVGFLVAIAAPYAAAQPAGPVGSAEPNEPIELRLSVETPPSHARNLSAQRWADAIERLTDGEVVVRTFPSGQLYDSAGAIKALASGALDMSVQASPTLSRFEPNLSVITLPMFFGARREHVRDILDGPLGEWLYARLADKNILVPGGHFEFAPNNSAYTTSMPVRSYDDLLGVKLATPPSPVVIVMLRAMGANPVPAARTEIVIQLSQGQVDGLGSVTDLTIAGAKLWDAGIRYGFADSAGWGVYFPLFSGVTWSRLSEPHRRAVRDAWAEVRDWARTYTAEELERGIAAIRANGIEMFEPSDDDRQRMRARMLDAQDELVRRGRMDPEFVGRVAARLAELQARGE